MMAPYHPKPFAALSPLSGPPPGAVEAVIISYQQNMLKMVTDFSHAQQTVMLAYLESVNSPRVDRFPSTLQSLQPMLFNEQQTHVNHDQNVESSVAVADHSHPGEQLSEQAIEARQDDVVQLEPSKISSEVCDVEELISVFTELVSERTGYPLDMLDPTLDLESDLGIDSIKRIEILSNFRKRLPETIQIQLEENLEAIAGVKTLSEIFEWIRTTCV